MRSSRIGSWRRPRMPSHRLLINAKCSNGRQLTRRQADLCQFFLSSWPRPGRRDRRLRLAQRRDTNPGTIALPFKTIGKAAEAATPGTTVRVAPGVYSQILETSASGTRSTIRYVSDVPWGAKVRTSGSDDHWSGPTLAATSTSRASMLVATGPEKSTIMARRSHRRQPRTRHSGGRLPG